MTAIAHTPGLGARVLRTAARGAVLVGAAIVLGIILEQVIHDAGGFNGGGSGAAGGTVTSTTLPGLPTTTTIPTGGRPPAQVKVAVINASGVSQAAATKANVLRGDGYQVVGTGNSTTLATGNTVGCQTGFAREAAVLAARVGTGTQIGVFPNPPPAVATAANCVVTLGR
jgi:hypothetical protein